MRWLLVLLPLVACSLTVADAPAQTPFALQGLGQNVETGSARDTGRGGWGLADRDTLVPGALNQAALADLRYAQLLFSGRGVRTLDSGPERDRTTWRTQLPSVRLAVPLRDARLALHTGFNMKRSFVYESFHVYDIERFGEPVPVDEEYERTGNLVEIPVGLAWRPLDALALGVSVNLVRGIVEDRVTQEFGGPGANEYVERLDPKGSSFTVSGLWEAPGPFSLGASLTTAHDLDVERSVELGAVAGDFSATETVSMPAAYRAGFMIDLGRHWRFGADGAYTAFGDLGPDTVWGPHVRDEWSVAVGFERRMHRLARARDYAMPLRFGVRWGRWGHTLGGEPIDERAVSLGTGLPFRNWLGTIDMAVSYAWIGDEAKNGWESQELSLGLSISGLERLVF